MARNLLIIDDDRFFCKSLTTHLSDQAIEISSVHTIKDAEEFTKNSKLDVILLDQKLPDGNGIDLCKTILQASEQAKIIFITAFPSFENAVKALRNGAFDYLSKPLEIEEVGITIDLAFRTLELENVEQVQNFKNRQEHEQNILIGKDGGLKHIYKHIELAAINQVPVLITGETGTGKNVVAKSIHYLSKNKENSFIGINCAALPENLIESELFGHEKGAFTGANSSKKGIFELADGGTLFLDEIGEIPLNLQSKLLGVLDDGKVRRIGGQSFRKISSRIIAATNIHLENAVHSKEFRKDLFYRLSVLPINVPPLRERKEDIEPLCRYFIHNSAYNQSISLPPKEVEHLVNYSWPGNVRELKNIIERSLIFMEDNHIFPSTLLTNHSTKTFSDQQQISTNTIRSLAEVEKSHIINTLKLLKNNHTVTAKKLGISRSTLLRKLKAFN